MSSKKEEVFEKIETMSNKPFVDWDKTPEIEGVVSNIREISGEFGTQEVCDVGDWAVNISAALRSLPRFEGEYLRVRYTGIQESKKGRKFKSFDIFRRK